MRLITAVLACLLLAMPHAVLAAPEAELWPRWEAHDPASAVTVDHTLWDRWLRQHVAAGDDGINRVAYRTVDGANKDALDSYIAALGAVRVTALNRDEQRAFWINLYNAGTVQVVLDHYPVASIRDIDISPGLFADGPWGKKLFPVENEMLSLDDIEHRILRPIWRDPRIHYAVNCASIGCPNLIREAFTAVNTDDLLTRAARAYVNHPRGARIENGELIVSSIYEWFQADFGGSDAGVIAHLREFAGDELATALEGATRIADDGYDWSLNDTARR
ncbi:MAG: DUF547 domain-containing protein [Rhodospirillales bacterium]